jgi:hypothetical protein
VAKLDHDFVDQVTIGALRKIKDVTSLSDSVDALVSVAILGRISCSVGRMLSEHLHVEDSGGSNTADDPVSKDAEGSGDEEGRGAVERAGENDQSALDPVCTPREQASECSELESEPESSPKATGAAPASETAADVEHAVDGTSSLFTASTETLSAIESSNSRLSSGKRDSGDDEEEEGSMEESVEKKLIRATSVVASELLDEQSKGCYVDALSSVIFGTRLATKSKSSLEPPSAASATAWSDEIGINSLSPPPSMISFSHKQLGSMTTRVLIQLNWAVGRLPAVSNTLILSFFCSRFVVVLLSFCVRFVVTD